MKNVAIAILGLLTVSGCTNPGFYVPPDGFVEPVSQQCRGLIREQEFVACTRAVRAGEPYYIPPRGPQKLE